MHWYLMSGCFCVWNKIHRHLHTAKKNSEQQQRASTQSKRICVSFFVVVVVGFVATFFFIVSEYLRLDAESYVSVCKCGDCARLALWLRLCFSAALFTINVCCCLLHKQQNEKKKQYFKVKGLSRKRARVQSQRNSLIQLSIIVYS